MSLARWGLIAVLVGVVACSDQDRVEVTPTASAVTAAVVERVFPTPTPLPASILNDGCPVTQPNGAVPPGEDPSPYHYGNGALWTALWPQGTVAFGPDAPGSRSDLDGSLSMKWPWWRGVEGELTITGRRLDGEAPPLRASIPDGYGNTGFQASALIFPMPGCWEVTARAGAASLSFIVRVISSYSPFVRYEVGDVALETCPVTQPNGVLPPGDDEELAYGNGGVSTYLWPDGRVVPGREAVRVRADGRLAVEWWWLRWTTGVLQVSGRRLDAASEPLRVEEEPASGEGMIRTVLLFSSPGCWEVTARIGDAGTVFVTLVEEW